MKLGDFGFAVLGNTAYGVYGTPGYIAPEVLMCHTIKKNYDRSCDMWSVGAVLYELLTGDKLVARECVNIMNKCVYPEKKWEKVDNQFKPYIKILQKILISSPKSRLSASDVLSMIQKV